MPQVPAPTEETPLGALLASALVTPATRAALTGRLDDGAVASTPGFFNAAERATLTAVCARLLPPDTTLPPAEAVRGIESRRAAGEGDGWRYDALPPDAESFRLALAALDAGNFADLPIAGQE